jgi:hypothetical protein
METRRTKTLTAAAHGTARLMIDKDRTSLLRRNTRRGRLIVTQRHHAEITRSSVDSPDCESGRPREQSGTPRAESFTRESLCDKLPHDMRRRTALRALRAHLHPMVAAPHSAPPAWPNRPAVARKNQGQRRIHSAVVVEAAAQPRSHHDTHLGEPVERGAPIMLAAPAPFLLPTSPTEKVQMVLTQPELPVRRCATQASAIRT